MMNRFLHFLRQDERGAAAIEFAFIVPILTGLLLFGAEGWLRINQVSQMRSAVQTTARYYQSNGNDDGVAAQLGLQAWSHAPGDASLNTTRACSCAGAGASCTSPCPDNTLPQVYITVTANGTWSGLMHSQVLTETGQVRVR
jgi:Flp pilus assembly protein TadG